MVRAGLRDRARVAGRDTRDVRPVERDVRNERLAALAAGVRAGNARATMIFPFTQARPPRGKPAGYENPSLQERAAMVDAVVDDPDLHPVAAQPAQRGELGADHVGASVRGERVAHVRVDLRDDAELHQARKLARRQLDREAVQHDPVALQHRRLEIARSIRAAAARCAVASRARYARDDAERVFSFVRVALCSERPPQAAASGWPRAARRRASSPRPCPAGT